MSPTLLKKFRDGENVNILCIDHIGVKRIMQFQLNKKEKNVCWEQYVYFKGNKANAAKWNECLSLKEIDKIIQENKKLWAEYSGDMLTSLANQVG